MDESGQSQKAQLGCGTLILIAIIVMLFSGGSSNRDLQKKIVRLEEKVEQLETKIDLLLEREKPAPASEPKKEE